MAVLDKFTATVSAKGQVVLPKAVCQALRWHVGTRLTVESTADGVLLRPGPAFAETRPEDVFGCLADDVPPDPSPTWRRVFWKRHGVTMRATDTNVVVHTSQATILTKPPEQERQSVREMYVDSK